MSAKAQVIWWGTAGMALLLALWLLGQAILPFIIGAGVAYLLDPLADRLEARGLSRGAATAVIFGLFIFVAALLLLIIIPAMIRQMLDLVQILPELTAQLRAFIETRFPTIGERIAELHGNIPGLGDTIREKGAALLNTLLSSAMSFVNVLVLLFVVPIVTVYMLLDWDRMVAAIPRSHPLARRKSLALAELAQQPFVVHGPVSVLHTVIMLACQQAGFVPMVTQEVTQVQAVLSLVQSGLGVALLPARMSRFAPESVALLPLREPVAIEMGLAVSPDAGPAVANFVSVAMAASDIE